LKRDTRLTGSMPNNESDRPSLSSRFKERGRQ
jgi:hypothetical protein